MGKTFNMVGGGGGTNVVANPAMTGTEIDLQGLEVNGTKYKVPLIRPNLLDNAYFVGGGSQQGGGQFPINQKGQTSYTGSIKSIDRWVSSSSSYVGCELLSTGVKQNITGTISNNPRGIYQLVENSSSLVGKTVTVSALVVDYSCTVTQVFGIRYGGSGGAYIGADDVSFNSAGLITKTGVVRANTEQMVIRMAPGNGTLSGDYLTIAAMKLEIGDTQTLAHNEGTEENPVWVLNEIPNYTEELWKCQRYYQLFASSTYRPTYGEDYRPPMRLHSPTKGTISIGGTTYYYADANL